MGALVTIQKLAKAGRILSKIVFILSIIGGIGCILGIIALAFIPHGFVLFGVTIRELVEVKIETSIGTAYAAMAMGIVIAAGEAVLSRIAEKYFVHELAAGTPFTFEGAKEMKRLGFCAILIPIGAAIVGGIVYGITAAIVGNVTDMHISVTTSLGLGIAFLVVSVLCRHGAELREQRSTVTESADT